MPAREDRAKRRRERRADAAGEARAHDRVRPADGQRASREAPASVAEPTRDGSGLVGGTVGFVRGSVAELKKVEWPGQNQVVQATTVVIIACIIVGAWLYANDFVWQRVVKDFLLK